MKLLVKIFTVLFVAMAATVPAMAQHQDKGRKGPEQRTEKARSREDVAKMQAQRMAKTLALSDDAAKKFEQAYTECQKELWALGKEGKVKAADTEEEAKKAIESRFERSQKILDVRKKYYKKYCEFLTQKQISRVYDMEKNMQSKFKANKQRKAPAKAKGAKAAKTAKPSKPAEK